MEQIEYSDFEKLDIRIGTIEKVEDHPNADKLIVLKVDFGDEQRTIVAGIKKYYNKENLEGKQISVIVNLKPAVLRGIESQGMLLAASDEDNLALLTPDKKIKENSKIS